MALNRVAIPIFEGPLDLLLHLIQKNELDITAVSLSQITEQYLHYLEVMQDLNIDLASEFLVVAAELARLKSKSLLPQDESSPEDLEEDLFDEEGLMRRLLEYQRFKQVAAELGSRPQLEADLFRRGSSDVQLFAQDPMQAPIRHEPAGKLIYLYRAMWERKGKPLSHLVAAEKISVRQKMVELLDFFKSAQQTSLIHLIASAATRTQKIGVFLAVLELVRMRLLRLAEEQVQGGWHLARSERSDADLVNYQEDFRS